MEDKYSKEIKFIKSRRKIANMTATEVIKKDEIRRNLILIGAVSWGVKVIDWMLFAIWVETPRKWGGMSFTNMETGAVSLLSFPCVAFTLIACFQFTQKGLQTNWLIYTSVTWFALMLIIPLIGTGVFEHETFLFLVIILVSIKEGAYLIWISTWSQMKSRFVPSMMLGRMYSWSYFLGHCILLVSSQIYPRGFTFFMKNQFIKKCFGKFRFVVFFFLLGLPLLLSTRLAYRIKVKAKEEEDIEI